MMTFIVTRKLSEDLNDIQHQIKNILERYTLDEQFKSN